MTERTGRGGTPATVVSEAQATAAGTLATAAVLITLFVVHCLRARNPLIHPSLFGSRRCRSAWPGGSSSEHRAARLIHLTC